MQEYDESDRLRRELILSKDITERLKEVEDALRRLEEGKIKRIVIFRNGPIQES